ncbi:hypothetical protein J437_LFUL013384, partial [Ladona fulva]
MSSSCIVYLDIWRVVLEDLDIRFFTTAAEVSLPSMQEWLAVANLGDMWGECTASTSSQRTFRKRSEGRILSVSEGNICNYRSNWFLELKEASPPQNDTRTYIPNSEGVRSAEMARPGRERVKTFLKDNALTFATILGVFAGVALGIILRKVRHGAWKPREVMYVQYVGELFLRMLKSLILPLIMSSLISAIGSLDLKLSGQIGIRAVTYYLVTTVMAIIQGIILVISIHPGRGDSSSIATQGSSRNVTTMDTLMDLVRNMFPPNLVQAAIS